MTTAKEFLNEQEVSELLGLHKFTLQQWRARRVGPTYTKLGRSVRYARGDVDAWLHAQRITCKPSTAG